MSKIISLIANSGIQFHKFKIQIDPNQDVIKTMGFVETMEDDTTLAFQYACYLPDQDVWVSKFVAQNEGWLDANDNIILDKINSSTAKIFALREEEYFTVSDVLDCLHLYASKEKDIWLPVPFFKRNSDNKSLFGPISWARMVLKDISEPKSKIKTYQVILAFDTKIDTANHEIYYAPRKEDTSEGENIFALPNDENQIFNFCHSAEHGCEWVERYLRELRIERDGKEPENFPFYKHVAQFIYLIKYLSFSNQFPIIELYTDDKVPIDVDLVLDIGNSNTFGVLFESPAKNDKSFNFNAVQKLTLNDLSDIQKSYNEPFSMRLAFAEAKFGKIDNHKYKNFKWPSLLRVGNEASRLISEYVIDMNKGQETNTHNSSPKRYLWDSSPSEVPWEFITSQNSKSKISIYYEGISEQFTYNGEYTTDGNFSTNPHYSRKSLLTFVMIEIILHAISQCNSHEFRLKHGYIERPRNLKRITVTCPTSIVQKEQVILRKAAEEAVKALSRFFSGSFLDISINDDESLGLQIIPSPKDLAKKLSLLKERKDWIYDEATCGQFVFLYAEIAERYLNNPSIFFNLYGKKRQDVTYPDRNALTIGSIDIGGGTMDLMICAYQYEGGSEQTAIIPHPLYWESFNLAGDDLLKEVVQQIVLEGQINSETERGCKGVIRNAAEAAGVTNVVEKMQNFFGLDSNRAGFLQRIIRKNFVVQVAIPVALRYLRHATENKEDIEIGFDDIFTENKPNKEILDFFNRHFTPLRFEDIRWKLSCERVFSIVETTFDPIFRQLSAILSAYGIDYLLLAGKPTTIPKVRELFVKYYPVSPDRIITLKDYRVGRWYPFANDIGYFEDTKSIVAVGAVIALMGGKLDKLGNFTIRTELLKRKLISTADYIGLFNKYKQTIDEIFLSPDENSYDLEVYSLPIVLGYKQLPNRSYRGRPIYNIDFNNDFIKERMKENDLFASEVELAKKVEDYKLTVKSRLPFRLKLKRTWSESREEIFIESIKDASRNEISKSLLTINLVTLPNGVYWLDSGEFVLTIK